VAPGIDALTHAGTSPHRLATLSTLIQLTTPTWGSEVQRGARWRRVDTLGQLGGWVERAPTRERTQLGRNRLGCRYLAEMEQREFRNMLSRSGELRDVRVVASVDGGTLVLETTYEFSERGESDRKPLVIGLMASPLILDSVHVVAGRAVELSDPEASGSAKPGIVMVYPEAEAGWADVSVLLRLIWRGQPDAQPESYLGIPNHLPMVIRGVPVGTEVSRSPHITLVLDPSSRPCLCSGTVDGTAWPTGPEPFQILRGTFARPGSRIIDVPIPSDIPPTRHGIACTAAVFETSTPDERALFAGMALMSQDLVERMLGVPVTVRLLAVDENCDPEVRNTNPSTTLRFSSLPDGSQLRIGEIVQMLALSWWSTGVQLNGSRAGAINSAIATSIALRVARALIEAPFEPPVIPTILAKALYVAMDGNPALKQSFRDLTKRWWGLVVPDRDFIVWSLEQGISVPQEFLEPRESAVSPEGGSA
jgi:hypothetical protein